MTNISLSLASMILSFFLNKLKSLVFVFISIFRKALFCIKRRNSNCDVIPLTHVISKTEHSSNWGDWDEDSSNEPRTVQDHINLYRKQKIQSSDSYDPEEQLHFFEDMTPNITKQTKVFVNNDLTNGIRNHSTNRLNLMENTFTPELIEWEDNSGWEGENLENDAQKLLRETKKLEREQRSLQQQQKRQEKKISRYLGTKVTI